MAAAAPAVLLGNAAGLSYCEVARPGLIPPNGLVYFPVGPGHMLNGLLKRCPTVPRLLSVSSACDGTRPSLASASSEVAVGAVAAGVPGSAVTGAFDVVAVAVGGFV